MFTYRALSLVTFAYSTWHLTNAVTIQSRASSPSCKVIPGDSEWPSQITWQELNQTVGGRLIATVPEAHVCHSLTLGYASPVDNAACDALKTPWNWDGSPPSLYVHCLTFSLCRSMRGLTDESLYASNIVVSQD